MTKRNLFFSFLSAITGMLLVGFTGFYFILNPGPSPIHRVFVASAHGTAQIDPSPIPKAESIVQNLGIISAPIPILMFHYVRSVSKVDDPLGYDLSIEPTLFSSYLDRLSQAGYETITPTQFLTGKVPKNSIMLTFDDGYTDFYQTAYPILSKHHMTAVSFVISGFLDDKDGRYLTRSQVKNLSDAGIEIGSHTVDHANLAEVDPKRAQDELLISRQVLEQITGKPVKSIAYPSGKYNENTLRLADFVGYSFGVTTEPGISLPASNKLKLPRIRVRGGESAAILLDTIKKAETLSIGTTSTH